MRPLKLWVTHVNIQSWPTRSSWALDIPRPPEQGLGSWRRFLNAQSGMCPGASRQHHDWTRRVRSRSTYYGGADGVQPTVQLEALAAGRAEGARYGLAPMWGVGHSINRGINLLLPTFHQFLARRYPDHLDARNGVPVLVPFEEADGWLASMESFAEYRHDGPAVPMLVARASEYPGDASTASWMIDAFVAHAWQAFVAHRQTPVRIVSPQGHQHPAPENPMTFVEEGAGRRPGRGGDRHWHGTKGCTHLGRAALWGSAPGEIVGPGSVQVVFEGVVLPVAGAHPLIAEVNYDDGQQRVSHPVTVQVVRAGCPSPDAGYQVICVAQ